MAGAAARRLGWLRRQDGHVLVQLVLYLALPALVFLVILRADLTGALVLVPVAGWIIHAILLSGVLLTCRAAAVPRGRTGALAVSIAVGNTGFFGIPLIAASGHGVSVAA